MRLHWKPDYTALVLSYVYVFGVLAYAEILRRGGRRRVESTRKFIHIGVGMWSVGTGLLFHNWWYALIPPASFVIINAISYWRGSLKAMETGERGNLGTVYFPIAFGCLIYFWWNLPVGLVAAMMPLTWGDSMAAVVGQRYGHYHYTVGGRTRSLEGSLGMFVSAWVTIFLTLLVMPYLAGRPAINWLLALMYGGVVALASTVVEALSPWGIDNLTVPAASTLVLFLLCRGSPSL